MLRMRFVGPPDRGNIYNTPTVAATTTESALIYENTTPMVRMWWPRTLARWILCAGELIHLVVFLKARGGGGLMTLGEGDGGGEKEGCGFRRGPTRGPAGGEVETVLEK